MKLHLFEAVTAGQQHRNWGRFCVGVPGQEWEWASALPDDPGGGPLLRRLGWTRRHIWVWDLATGEGAMFQHGGVARADLDKHQIHVCPLFEGFLQWLYGQDLTDIENLPRVVPVDAEFRFYGERRGPGAWFDRSTGTLTVLRGGRGMCVGRCPGSQRRDRHGLPRWPGIGA